MCAIILVQLPHTLFPFLSARRLLLLAPVCRDLKRRALFLSNHACDLLWPDFYCTKFVSVVCTIRSF